MSKAEAAHEIAEELKAAEAAIDSALVRVATLAAKLPQAWLKADLSCVVGMGAFDRAGALVGAMTQARREAGEMHRILDGVRAKIGLPESGWGDKMPEPAIRPADNVVPLAA